MVSRRQLGFLLVFLLFLSCSADGSRRGVHLFFELSGSDINSQLASFTLTLYRNPGAQAAFCAGWDQASRWTPTGGEYFDSRTGSTLATLADRTFSFELPVEPFGFTFVGFTADHDPADPKDLARGCTVASLIEGPNPQVNLRIKEIIWPEPPGVCGDGEVGGDELCDDGNTVDDATCSSGCLSMQVFQVNTVYENSQIQPSIAGADGEYILAWTSGGSATGVERDQHVMARHVDRFGQPLGIGSYTTDLKLNISSTSQAQYRPDVAMGDGRFMALWLDNGPGTGVPAGDVVWRSLPFGSGTGVGEVTLNVGSQEESQDWARIGGAGVNRYLAAWISKSTLPSHAVCNTYGGSAWGTEINCSATASDGERFVDAALSADAAAAVWARDVDIIMQRFDETGERDGAEVHVNIPSGGTCGYPAAAFDGGGRLLVVWRLETAEGGLQIMGRLYDASGSPAAAMDFQINSTDLTAGPGTSSNPYYVPDVAGTPGGGMFLVVWDAPGEGGGRARIVLGHDSFGVQRYLPDPVDGYFRSTDDFTLTPDVPASMDEFRAGCAAADLCMVVWSDASLVVDTDNAGIRAIVVPVLQP
jgi:cysteine-rich repeat protein